LPAIDAPASTFMADMRYVPWMPRPSGK